MIIPPAANCSGGDHEAGAKCDVLMLAMPTATKNNRIASFNATIHSSALPMSPTSSRFSPAIRITLRLIST